LDIYAKNLDLVSDGDQIVSGITVWALPGHTAGHMGLRVGETLVLCADILHSDALQLPDPTVSSIYDDDPVQATQSRQAALKEIANRDLIFSGSHGSHFEKFRRLRADGDNYRTVPL
jgi:glyoxylase-like metal-dependent hydrolase (beta-lactamase superfamily II)